MTKRLTQSSALPRPPIVAVLGHVDHGKTTLLDTIRQTDVASREHGGITQHIGAYQMTVRPKGEPSSRGAPRRGIPAEHKGILPRQSAGQDDFSAEGRTITFIDTPGHEAFAKMRARGAKVADIALLVVAADDSVKPQTQESIDHIRAARIPLIVVVNKTDLASANIEKVKQDLAKAGIQVEGFGGDVPLVPISAKVGTGIPDLLDMILLVAQMQGLTSQPKAPLEVEVIETRVDKGKGMVATVIVKKGTLKAGMELFEGSKTLAKVRACFDENGKPVAEAPASKPVEVLGFAVLPQVGSVLYDRPLEREPTAQPSLKKPGDMPDFLKPMVESEKQKLTIVLKADTAGSLEAISATLGERVEVAGKGIGDITDADILLAKSVGAIIIGFNAQCKPPVAKLAQTEKVTWRAYTIIYDLLRELEEVIAGLKQVAQERELGRGKIIAEFPYEKQRVAGTRVVSGRLARGDTVKIIREETEVGKARIKSMRQGKIDVTKVETGEECGILFDRTVDFALQDAIIAVTTG